MKRSRKKKLFRAGDLLWSFPPAARIADLRLPRWPVRSNSLPHSCSLSKSNMR